MVKKPFLLFVLFLFVFLASGCTIGRGIEGVGQGFKEDMKVAQEWDVWVKKNLW
ncbi:MAG: hypothetical protein PHU59_00855 [Candidatus Omnitrophica bacterium]|jgi:hypothetical protein|nr:hypothetical protein [Candidatus Omnitrophota bacterium]